jgi:hypothetical protein
MGATAAHAALAPAAGTASDGTWTHFPAVTLPDGEESGSFVYDAPRARLLVFGGRTVTGPSNKVWALSLMGPPQWTLITPLGTPPVPRYTQTMVYDSARDRLLVFGGTSDGTTAFSDLWELTLSGVPAWNQLSPVNAPPGRIAHVAVYDPAGDRMILFGGYNAGFKNDTWQLALAGTPTWSQLNPSGALPIPRDFSTAIYDPVGQRMVMFGGNASANGVPPAHPVNDTWALSLVGSPAWTQLPTGFGPSARLAHESFYDPMRHRLLIMGGTDGTTWLNDVAALTLDPVLVWSPILPAGTPPGPRSGEAFVWDPAADRAIVFAGKSLTGIYADAFSLNLSGSPEWAPLAPAPPARLAHRPIYDPVRNRLVQFAGITGPSPLTFVNDTWALPLDGSNHWTLLDTPGSTRPAPRASHVDVHDAAHDRMILFGGNDDSNLYNDVWTYELAAQTWTLIAPAGTPPSPRESMAGVYDAARSRLLVFGGWNGTASLNESWELDFLPTPTWKPFTVLGTPPPARFGHTMVYDGPRDRLVVYGGSDNATLYGDAWTVNLGGTPAWTQLAPAGTPPDGRFGHNAMYDGLRDRMIVFGGYANPGGFVNAVYALNFAGGTPSWSQLAPAGTPPSERDFAGAIYDAGHDRFVITEGNGAIFPPAGDTWALSWGDVPTPTLLSLADYDTAPGRVTLRWQATDAGNIAAIVERSADAATWVTLGAPRREGTDLLVYEDAGLAPGRYSYRLDYSDGAVQRRSDPVVVDISAEARLALGGFRPNPALETASISFSLPDKRPASLKVHDVRGRLVFSREVGELGPGAHLLRLDNSRRLAPGIYWIRLVRPEGVLTTKGIVVR